MDTTNTVMTPLMVAEETHSSLRFIYKELKSGTIPHVKLGDKYLIGRESFLKWVNQGK
jgi:excisionase family DNA binding protein